MPKRSKKLDSLSLFRGFFGHLFDFFFQGLRDAKKGGPGARSKLDNFFVDLGVSPEGLRRVPVSTGAQFSLLQPSPKRAPKWEPKWSVLGAKVITILLFVRPCRENRPSKSFDFFDMSSENLSDALAQGVG